VLDEDFKSWMTYLRPGSSSRCTPTGAVRPSARSCGPRHSCRRTPPCRLSRGVKPPDDSLRDLRKDTRRAGVAIRPAIATSASQHRVRRPLSPRPSTSSIAPVARRGSAARRSTPLSTSPGRTSVPRVCPRTAAYTVSRRARCRGVPACRGRAVEGGAQFADDWGLDLRHPGSHLQLRGGCQGWIARSSAASLERGSGESYVADLLQPIGGAR
jgi:hypothetical protein